MKKIIGMIFLCGLLLTACTPKETPGEQGFTITGGSDRMQEENSVLTFSMRVPETLNPLRNREATVDLALKLLFQPLIAFDESGKCIPSVAQSWTVSPDGTTVSLVLRQDIQWHDGTTLTADDVIFSLDTIGGSAEDAVYKRVGDYISGYTKTGTYSLDIRFREVFSSNLWCLNFPVIPAHYYRGQTDPKSVVSQTPIGSGPYRLEAYEMASEMRLSANPSYVGGVPTIGDIRVKITSGAQTDIYAFEQGMTDVLVTNANQAGRYTTENIAGIHQYPSRNYDFIAFNFNKSLFQDKQMRQAVAYALPKKNICESVYLQYATMTNTPINPKSWLYEENVAPYEYDTTMAGTLLKNAGWADSNQDGMLERDTEQGQEQLAVTLLVNQENAARRQVANKLKEELSLLGFSVTIDSVPFDQYQEKLKNGSYDLAVGGWRMSATTDLGPFFHTNGANNYIGYKDEQMDMLLATARSAVGEGKTLLAYSGLQKRIAEELPYISIAYTNDAVFTSNHIGGEVKPTVDNPFHTVAQWTYDQNKKQ